MIVEKKCRPIERIITDKPKIDLSLLRKRGSAKTPSGLILGYMQRARHDGNMELTILFQEIYKQILPLEKKQTRPLIEIEIMDGWKGKDNLEIYNGLEDNIVIISHQKDKDTGEISKSTHIVLHEDLNRILFFIKKWKVGESHRCYDFAEILGEKDWKEIWKKRTGVYFKKYYFPIKILEKLKLISYSGRGQITKIR